MSTESQNYRETLRVGIAVAVTVLVCAFVDFSGFVVTGIIIFWMLGPVLHIRKALRLRNYPQSNIIKFPGAQDQFRDIAYQCLGLIAIVFAGVSGWFWDALGMNQLALLILGALMIFAGFLKSPGGSVVINTGEIKLGNLTNISPDEFKRIEVSQDAIRFLTEDLLLENYTGLALAQTDIDAVIAFLHKHLHGEEIHISQA